MGKKKSSMSEQENKKIKSCELLVGKDKRSKMLVPVTYLSHNSDFAFRVIETSISDLLLLDELG